MELRTIKRKKEEKEKLLVIHFLQRLHQNIFEVKKYETGKLTIKIVNFINGLLKLCAL